MEVNMPKVAYDGEDEEGEEGREEGMEEEEVPLEPVIEIRVDPFLKYPEPSHHLHPAELRIRSPLTAVNSYTEYDPYLGRVDLAFPRKQTGARPNSIYRKPPEIREPEVDKWEKFKAEIGLWQPMSVTSIARKYDPAFVEPTSVPELQFY